LRDFSRTGIYFTLSGLGPPATIDPSAHRHFQQPPYYNDEEHQERIPVREGRQTKFLDSIEDYDFARRRAFGIWSTDRYDAENHPVLREASCSQGWCFGVDVVCAMRP
jgi:hypothetical protein